MFNYNQLITCFINYGSVYPLPRNLTMKGFFQFREITKARFIAKILFSTRDEMVDKIERIKLAKVVFEAMRTAKEKINNPGQKRRYILLKSELTQQDRMINPAIQRDFKLCFLPLSINVDIAIPLEDQKNNRFKFFTSTRGKEAFAVMGSSYLSPKKITEPAHVLDALHLAFVGHDFLLAVSDGCGGHYGEEEQDRNIARVAYFSGKEATRLFSLYEHPDELKMNLRELLNAVTEKIKQKMQKSIERSTLLAARLFHQDDQYRLIGLNIGDSMMGCWDSVKQTFKTLIPACVSISTKLGSSPAMLPDGYVDRDIQVIDVMIPKEAWVFLLSDGAYDYLPQYHKDTEEGLRYSYLNSDFMERLFQSLPNTANAGDYARAILEASIKEIESRRAACLLEPMGDDITICSLQPVAFV